MADTLTAAAPESVAAPVTPGLADAGQAASASTPPDANNPAASPVATPSGQAAPASTPKYRFKDQTEAERAHSELQSRYSRLGDPEQAAQMLGLVRSLQADPKFREWAQARLAEQEAGSSDPETVKAMQIVESVAERKARELVAPLAAQAAQARLAGVFQAMTQQHGPEWETYKPAMAELFAKGVQQGFFSPAMNQNVSLEFVNHLYTLAVNQDPNYAAKRYQKDLAAKQAASTQATPGAPPTAVAPPSVRNFEDAFAAAKRAHGIA